MSSFIAVDLGGTRTRVALVAESQGIRAKRTCQTPREPKDPGEITDFISCMIRSLGPAEEIGEASGIGIGAAGPVDTGTGAVINAPNLPFHRIPLAGPLHEEFGLPVRIANDCHTGVIGEYAFGGGQGCRNLVYITLSTGIGAGVIANGRIVLGRGGNAGEVGHFSVDSLYNAPCGCGGTGHWEGYASGRYIPRFFAIWSRANGADCSAAWTRSPEGIFSAARENNPAALGFIGELGRINARGISDAIVAYDPERIVLDGGVVMGNEDLIMPGIGRYIDRFLPVPEIITSRLGGDAPLLGAAVIAGGYETMAGSLAP
jgi:glucokinase